ncbi:hypothetical protein [Niallia sp. Krafla_26]|uniref:hypothetical protein n=1 Tax=Niallia sp. Krafla_26 TaxID=3064703 RepID=UPI003D17C499
MEKNDNEKEKLINAISGNLNESIGETQISELLKGNKVEIPMTNKSESTEEIKKLEKEIENINQEIHDIKLLLETFNNTSEKLVNLYTNEKIENPVLIYKKLTDMEKELTEIKQIVLWLS